MSPVVFLKTCIPFLILSILVQTDSTISCFFSPTVTVRVINDLRDYDGFLVMHCASKDDDLGYQHISVFGEFHWSFCDSVLGNTLFFCHLWWDSPEGKKEKAFDVFKSSWAERCYSGVCTWKARSDGIYFTGANPPKDWQYRYQWEQERRQNRTITSVGGV